MATLYIVATPIGNLEDLTLRARRVLGEVDRVLAEDTRRTGLLLQHIGVRRPLVSLHAHNEAERVGRVLEWLNAGETLALASDAGTPLVSDPGARLVNAVVEAGHTVVPIPGPSAVLAALVGAGLPSDRFSFLGFVPRKGGARRDTLQQIAGSPDTTLVFESPERISVLLDDLVELCGADREACVARELTKLHETFHRGTLASLRDEFAGASVKGEICVVIAPAPSGDSAIEHGEARDAAAALATALLGAGESPSRVARELARQTTLGRNEAYALVQALGDEAGA